LPVFCYFIGMIEQLLAFEINGFTNVTVAGMSKSDHGLTKASLASMPSSRVLEIKSLDDLNLNLIGNNPFVDPASGRFTPSMAA